MCGLPKGCEVWTDVVGTTKATIHHGLQATCQGQRGMYTPRDGGAELIAYECVSFGVGREVFVVLEEEVGIDINAEVVPCGVGHGVAFGRRKVVIEGIGLRKGECRRKNESRQ